MADRDHPRPMVTGNGAPATGRHDGSSAHGHSKWVANEGGKLHEEWLDEQRAKRKADRDIPVVDYFAPYDPPAHLMGKARPKPRRPSWAIRRR